MDLMMATLPGVAGAPAPIYPRRSRSQPTTTLDDGGFMTHPPESLDMYGLSRSEAVSGPSSPSAGSAVGGAGSINFCPSCGSKLQPSHRFCFNCGFATETLHGGQSATAGTRHLQAPGPQSAPLLASHTPYYPTQPLSAVASQSSMAWLTGPPPGPALGPPGGGLSSNSCVIHPRGTSGDQPLLPPVPSFSFLDLDGGRGHASDGGIAALSGSLSGSAAYSPVLAPTVAAPLSNTTQLEIQAQTQTLSALADPFHGSWSTFGAYPPAPAPAKPAASRPTW
jgi:hypothetical protein